jgi:hypothetical protein
MTGARDSQSATATADEVFLETHRYGHDLLNDPLLNKGTAFTEQERPAGTMEAHIKSRMWSAVYRAYRRCG